MKKIILITLILITVISCKKKGCINAFAENYNSEAKKDDGTCTFKADVLFYWDESTGNWLINNQRADNVKFYIDGNLIGSTTTNLLWLGSVDCRPLELQKFSKDLGLNKTSTSNYEIIDNNNFIVWKGSINFDASQCQIIKLKKGMVNHSASLHKKY